MAVVRPIDRVSVRHPSGNGFVGLDPAETYDPEDPIVQAYPEHFESDTPDSKARRGKIRKSVPVESATRAPGEKRGRTIREGQREAKGAEQVKIGGPDDPRRQGS